MAQDRNSSGQRQGSGRPGRQSQRGEGASQSGREETPPAENQQVPGEYSSFGWFPSEPIPDASDEWRSERQRAPRLSPPPRPRRKPPQKKKQGKVIGGLVALLLLLLVVLLVIFTKSGDGETTKGTGLPRRGDTDLAEEIVLDTPMLLADGMLAFQFPASVLQLEQSAGSWAEFAALAGEEKIWLACTAEVSVSGPDGWESILKEECGKQMRDFLQENPADIQETYDKDLNQYIIEGTLQNKGKKNGTSFVVRTVSYQGHLLTTGAIAEKERLPGYDQLAIRMANTVQKANPPASLSEEGASAAGNTQAPDPGGDEPGPSKT